MEEILKLACQGDSDSLASLYEQTNRKAYCLALQLLKDEDAAWDILQDSYIKAFENLTQLRDANKFQGWIDTIVINKSKDYLKKKKPLLFSQLTADNQEENLPEFENESREFVPEAVVDYEETKRLIQEIIDELPEEQRISIILHYMEELPVKQIAAIMECSEGTVKSRLNYGRKQIKVKVLELEKKGTKLYCQPIIPFLYFLFREQIKTCLVPSMLEAGSILTNQAVLGTAAKEGASAAAKGLKIKLFVAASLVVIGGGVVSVVASINKDEEIVQMTTIVMETTQLQTEETTLPENSEEIQESEEPLSGWIQDDYGWRYFKKTGELATNDWIADHDEDDGSTICFYYLGEEGYRVTEWIEIDGEIEQFNEDGIYLGDVWQDNPHMIYIDEDILIE